MASIEEVLWSMDSLSRKMLSDAIKEYQKTKSSKALKEITAILRNWDEDEVKVLLPDFMKKLK